MKLEVKVTRKQGQPNKITIKEHTDHNGSVYWAASFVEANHGMAARTSIGETKEDAYILAHEYIMNNIDREAIIDPLLCAKEIVEDEDD